VTAAIYSELHNQRIEQAKLFIQLLFRMLRAGTTRCGYHPLLVRREAPHKKRIQQTSPPANKFASGLAADPQRVIRSMYEKSLKYRINTIN
jgi:hypothetical protein